MYQSRFWLGAKVFGCGVLLLFVVGAGCFTIRYFNNAATVVGNEIAPDQLLRKYEWFKNAAAQLDKKQADLKIYNVRVKEFVQIPRQKMDRHDKSELNLLRAERTGVASSYNQLASEYNAQMAKINWRFCNVGSLPQGATEPLPRAFKSYITH